MHLSSQSPKLFSRVIHVIAVNFREPLFCSSLAVSEGVENAFIGLKKKKKKPVSSEACSLSTKQHLLKFVRNWHGFWQVETDSLNHLAGRN